MPQFLQRTIAVRLKWYSGVRIILKFIANELQVRHVDHQGRDA
jgi:hypothetical protein